MMGGVRTSDLSDVDRDVGVLKRRKNDVSVAKSLDGTWWSGLTSGEEVMVN